MTQDHKGSGHPMRRSLDCNWPGKSSCSSTLKNEFSMCWPRFIFSDNSHQLPLWPSSERDKLIWLDTAYLQIQYHNKHLQSNYLLPDSNSIPTERPGNDLSEREPIKVWNDKVLNICGCFSHFPLWPTPAPIILRHFRNSERRPKNKKKKIQYCV